MVGNITGRWIYKWRRYLTIQQLKKTELKKFELQKFHKRQMTGRVDISEVYLRKLQKNVSI